jgi:hypothetical protein
MLAQYGYPKEGENVKLKKSVKFEDFCRVILIPRREEYTKAGIRLWWSPKEFNSFKKERMAELEQPISQQLNTIKSTGVSCFEITIRVLVITNDTPAQSKALQGLGEFLWSDENENRFGTNIVVNYTCFRRADEVMNEVPFYYNVIVIDSPPGNSFQKFMRLRDLSPLSVIVCITKSQVLLHTEDCASEFADLVLARPELPSRSQWRDLVTLLVDRMESDDFLPSPLIQHYISTL